VSLLGKAEGAKPLTHPESEAAASCQKFVIDEPKDQSKSEE